MPGYVGGMRWALLSPVMRAGRAGFFRGAVLTGGGLTVVRLESWGPVWMRYLNVTRVARVPGLKE